VPLRPAAPACRGRSTFDVAQHHTSSRTHKYRSQPRGGLSEEEITARGASTRWQRIAQPDDIARAVLYLVSDVSDYVTGQTLFVTGGALMVP